MRFFWKSFFLISLFFGGLVFPGAFLVAKEGEVTSRTVKEIYSVHEKKSIFHHPLEVNLVKRFFSKTLVDDIVRDAPHLGLSCLSFDPLYDAQDARISGLHVGEPSVAGGETRVRVSFMNFTIKSELIFVLEREESGWKVADILYSDGTTLSHRLRSCLDRAI